MFLCLIVCKLLHVIVCYRIIVFVIACYYMYVIVRYLEVITWVKPYCTSYCILLSLIAQVQSPDSIIAQARSASAIMLSGDCTSAIRLKSVQYEVQYGLTHVIILLLLRHSLNVFFIVIKCFLYYYLIQL